MKSCCPFCTGGSQLRFKEKLVVAQDGRDPPGRDEVRQEEEIGRGRGVKSGPRDSGLQDQHCNLGEQIGMTDPLLRVMNWMGNLSQLHLMRNA